MARIDTILKAQGMTIGTVGERMIALNKDPKQLYPNTDEGRAALLASLNVQMKELDAMLPQAFATLPKDKIEVARVPRSEERRVGKGCVRMCRSWWSPDHEKKNIHIHNKKIALIIHK